MPERPRSAPMPSRVSDIDSIQGVGDVLAGRVDQGMVKPGDEMLFFLPTHRPPNPCTGKVFTGEMRHQCVDFASPGDNAGLNIKGLDKNNMPCSGDVMVYPDLKAQVQDGQGDWWQENGGITPSTIARAFRASLSWMATVWSCWARCSSSLWHPRHDCPVAPSIKVPPSCTGDETKCAVSGLASYYSRPQEA